MSGGLTDAGSIPAASTNSIPNDIRENSEAREKSGAGVMATYRPMLTQSNLKWSILMPAKLLTLSQPLSKGARLRCQVRKAKAVANCCVRSVL